MRSASLLFRARRNWAQKNCRARSGPAEEVASARTEGWGPGAGVLRPPFGPLADAGELRTGGDLNVVGQVRYRQHLSQVIGRPLVVFERRKRQRPIEKRSGAEVG